MTPENVQYTAVAREDVSGVPCARISVHLVWSRSESMAQTQTKVMLMAPPPTGIKLTCSVVHRLEPSGLSNDFKKRPK